MPLPTVTGVFNIFSLTSPISPITLFVYTAALALDESSWQPAGARDKSPHPLCVGTVLIAVAAQQI
jgi:hypothetical protein